MKLKKILALVTAIVLCSFALAMVPAAADESVEEYRLFNMTGQNYVAEIPFLNEYNRIIGRRLRGTGVDTVWTYNEKTITLDNSTGSSAVQYYVCGTNSIEYIKNNSTDLIDPFVDYVVEYEMVYLNSTGHVSIMLNYNYLYNIDVFVNPDGTGDIVLNYYDKPTEKSESVRADGSGLLNPYDGSELVRSLFGSEVSTLKNKKINISLRVQAQDNKMPKTIYMYINGKLVAKTIDNLYNKIETMGLLVEIPPEDSSATEITESLGYITAINCSGGSKAKIENVRVYTVDKSSVLPNATSVKVYANHYGNASLDTRIEYVTNNDGELVTNEQGEVVTLPGQTHGPDTEEIESNNQSEETNTGSQGENENTSEEEISSSETESEGIENTKKEPTVKPLIIILSIFGGVTLAAVICTVIIIANNKKRTL